MLASWLQVTVIFVNTYEHWLENPVRLACVTKLATNRNYIHEHCLKNPVRLVCVSWVATGSIYKHSTFVDSTFNRILSG